MARQLPENRDCAGVNTPPKRSISKPNASRMQGSATTTGFAGFSRRVVSQTRRELRYRWAMKIRFSLAWLFACLALPLGAPAANKRIPTHEDIWLMKRLTAPQVSPDGRWLVLSVVEPAYDDNS